MLKHRVQPKAEGPSRDSNIPLRFVNEAYERDEDDDIPSPRDQDIQQAKSVGMKMFSFWCSLNDKFITSWTSV